MEKHRLTCADCGVANCIWEEGQFPDFCMSTHIDQDILAEAMKEYEDPEIQKIARCAAEVETDGYCVQTRVEETINFAKKMGAKKIGIATCAGLLTETRILAKILRYHGFEVVGIVCKCGTQKKEDIGIPSYCNATGFNMCNPVFQAKFLNHEKTDLNILMGLCVGHDSQFFKFAEGYTTVLVAKDRVMGHNTVAALYQADKYLKKRLFPEKPAEDAQE